MNKKFVDRLTEFLDSEASDYSLEYDYEWDEDYECCQVKISLEHSPKQCCEVSFRYDEAKDDLSLELYEDNWETVREFDWTVKYFWMYISPKIWNET